jgi:spore coat protein U-like protein
MSFGIRNRSTFAKGAVALAFTACLAAGGAADAATTTGTLAVSARVGGYCVFSTWPFGPGNYTLNFGAYTPAGGNRDATTTLGVRCTNGVPFQIALNGGGSGSVTNRQMTSATAPTEKLGYQLYTDAARTIVWGDGSGGSVVATGTGGGFLALRSFTVYGRVPDSTANQGVAPLNNYQDTVTIVVTY